MQTDLNNKEDSLLDKIKLSWFWKKTTGLLSRFKKIITAVSIILGLLASFVTIQTYTNAEPKNIKSYFAKHKAANTSKVISYSGELFNDDSLHANELTLTGKLTSEIIRFDVSTTDTVEKKECNKPAGSIELVMKRITKGSTCRFDIIVDKDAEVVESFQVSWGNRGRIQLQLQESDKKIMRGMELMKKLSEADLSRNARQRSFESNARNIR